MGLPGQIKHGPIFHNSEREYLNERKSTGKSTGKSSRQCRSKSHLLHFQANAMIIGPSKGRIQAAMPGDNSHNHQRAMEDVCLPKS